MRTTFQSPRVSPGARSSSRSSVSLSEIRTTSELDDLFIPLFELAHQESRYASAPFNAVRCRSYYEHSILTDSNHHAAVVALFDARPVGILQLSCNYLYWTDIRVAVISIIFVLPSFRRTLAGARAFLSLLDYAASWSRLRRIDEIQIQVTSGTRLLSIDNSVRRMGFKQVGGNYVWPLPPL